jgi:flagellar biosynthetic protein FliQ
MSDDAIVRLTREALLLVLVVSGPPVVVSLLVGFVVSVLQATTQIQEQTLTFVPKLVAVFLTLAVAGPWIAAQLTRFTEALFLAFPEVVR